MELKGGYILQGLKEILPSGQNDFLDELLHTLCNFGIHSSQNFTDILNDPIYSVLHNIFARGFPTLPSIFIEKKFCELLSWTEQSRDNTVGDIFFNFRNDLLNRDEKIKLLKRALCIVDPRLNRNNVHKELIPTENTPDNNVEEKFLYDVLPRLLGDYSIQLIQPQRTMQSILKMSKRVRNLFDVNLGNFQDDFYAQRVDFAFEFPPKDSFSKGIVIEIDGAQHNIPPQFNLDQHRDDACNGVNWRTTRIPVNQVENLSQEVRNILTSYFNHPYSGVCRNNYDNPLYNTDDGLKALQLTLSPFGIARIQLALLQLLSAGKLRLDHPWSLVVIERDVPCANLAIEDFKQWMHHLFNLEGKGRKLPEIKLRVYNFLEFSNCELNRSLDNIFLYEDNPEYYDANIIIDISLLQRSGLTSLPSSFINQCKVVDPVVITIRSLHSIKGKYKLNCSNNVTYRSVFSLTNNGNQEINEEVHSSLVFLLQNIFRKEAFRSGQLEIIDKALKRENVIGLLPTGSGKSLCYQLACLLQPSATLVIDPLISLMKDQVQNLFTTGFNHIKKINSELSTLEMVDALDELRDGLYQFVFISPERFQIRKFRETLEDITNTDQYKIKQAVIDEAHCVSEWGHDFRPAYLRLGDLVREYCGEDVLIFGLTGTASFDVLSDVAREVRINQQGLVEANSFDRKELRFSITPKRIMREQADSSFKMNILKRVLRLIPRYFGYRDLADFYNPVHGKFINSGIVFCPHKGLNNNAFSPFSVGTVATEIITFLNGANNGGMGLNTVVDKYSGALNTDDRESVQDRFKNNETCILVATNAFGMGIDKPNIRFIIHYSSPHSIEAYYQEAGRAGRDRNNALCISIFSDDKHFFNINNAGQPIAAVFNPVVIFQGQGYREYLRAESSGSEAVKYSPPNVDFNYDYQNQPVDGTVFFNSTNFYLSQKNHINQVNNIPQPPFTQNNDAQRRIYFQNLNFPGYEIERKIFGGILQFINPALAALNLSVNLPFIINYIGQNGGLTLNDVPGDPGHNGYVERGIYRLVILGIINDYTKDYNAQVYTVELNQLTDTQIIENVRSYVKNYKSQAYVDQVENNIRNIVLPNNQDSIFYKAIYYLIEFIYNEIERKRRNALREFIRVLRLGSENITRFREEMDTYFNSKYLPLLREYITNYSIDILWQLIEEIDNDLDLVRHLYGASTRLLVEHDDNLLFQMLRSYASFIHPGFDKIQAIEYFKAFEKSENNPIMNNPNRKEISDWIVKFYNEILRRQPSANESVCVGISNFHLSWIQKFNNTLLRTNNG